MLNKISCGRNIFCQDLYPFWEESCQFKYHTDDTQFILICNSRVKFWAICNHNSSPTVNINDIHKFIWAGLCELVQQTKTLVSKLIIL